MVLFLTIFNFKNKRFPLVVPQAYVHLVCTSHQKDGIWLQCVQNYVVPQNHLRRILLCRTTISCEASAVHLSPVVPTPLSRVCPCIYKTSFTPLHIGKMPRTRSQAAASQGSLAISIQFWSVIMSGNKNVRKRRRRRDKGRLRLHNGYTFAPINFIQHRL